MSDDSDGWDYSQDPHIDPQAMRPQKSEAETPPLLECSLSEGAFCVNNFRVKHRAYLERVKANGVSEMQWKAVLKDWQTQLKHIDFEDVEEQAVIKILDAARLSSSVPQPMFYEILRRLGPDIISPDVLNEDSDLQPLLDRLKPNADQVQSSHFYRTFIYPEQAQGKEFLKRDLRLMLGNLSTDVAQEQTFGFIVSHVRTRRYHDVELAAIIRHLTRRIDDNQRKCFTDLASRLENDSAQSEHENGGALAASSHPRVEAQRFIIRCVEVIQRHRQSFYAAEIRNSQRGVIMFCVPFQIHDECVWQESEIDTWFKEREAEMAGRPNTVNVLRSIIDKERELWGTWKAQLEKRRAVKVKEPAIFNVDWSKPISNVTRSMVSYAREKAQLQELAQLAEEVKCVPHVIQDFNTQKTNGEQLVATERVDGQKRVAVFGYTLKDRTITPEHFSTASQSPVSVVVRRVPLLQWSNETESEDGHIYEIGVGLDGSYVQFNAEDKEGLFNRQGLGLRDDDELHFFRFIPQDRHASASRSVEELLPSSDGNQFSHVLLHLPSSDSKSVETSYNDIADSGGRFLINMNDSGAVVTEGIPYQALPVKPAASAAEYTSRGFRRLAVLIPPSVPQTVIEVVQTGKERSREQNNNRAGFSESAEIIAEVLSLAVIEKISIDDGRKEKMKQHLERNPLLLYYTTLELLDAFSDQFTEIIVEYWFEKLQLAGNHTALAHLSLEEAESREIILALITGKKRFSAGETILERATPTEREKPNATDAGAASSNAASLRRRPGRPVRIALASESHLKLLPLIITRETHFSQETIFIEETNFESTLLRLKGVSSASLTFVFVYITGKLSADQINRIVNVPSATMKLIFRNSQSITSLLELTNVRDKHIPDSIDKDFRVERRTVSYSTLSAVGSVVNFTAEELTRDPLALHLPDSYWEEAVVDAEVKTRLDWVNQVKDWVEQTDDETEGFASFVRVLITSDHRRTCDELEKTLGSVITVDAGDRKKFDELKVFLDRKVPGPPLAGRGKGKWTVARSQHEAMQPELFILSRGSFLPHSRLEVLVSRCCTREAKLLLLVNEPTSSLLRFRVFTGSRNPPQWIRVKTIFQRFAPCLRSVGEADLSAEDLVFHGLQLLWSHDAVLNDEHRSAVQDWMQASRDSSSPDMNVFAFLEHVDAAHVKDVIGALADVEPIENFKLESESLAMVLAVHVNRYLRFPSRIGPWPVSFLDFCKQPLVRFLSQIHRVEAYICFLFRRTAENARLRDEANKDCPFRCPLLANFVGVANVHSSSNPGSTLKGTFDGSAVLKNSRIPAPQYLDPGKGDAMVHVQEITEHRALMGAELHWEDIFLRWEKSGHDLTDESMDHILVYSPSRISVLLSMTQQRIVNLTLSPRALAAVSSDFEQCVRLFRRLASDDFRVLRTRTASVFWLILKSGGVLSDSVSSQFFENDQQILLEADVTLEPKSGADGSDLLSRVARAIVQLDAPDTLRRQRTVCDFLFSDGNEDVTVTILKDDAVKIGRSFVAACLDPERMRQVKEGLHGKAIYRFLKPILRWVQNPANGHAEEMREAVRPFRARFTARALSCIFENANYSSVTLEKQAELERARDGILRDCLAEQREPGSFLGQVLQPLCTEDNRSLAMDLLCVLAKPVEHGCDDSLPGIPTPQLDQSGPWLSAYLAFKEMFLDPDDSCQAAKSLFEAARHDPGFKLPFEESQVLCKMYVAFCKQGAFQTLDVTEQIRHHQSLLRIDEARHAVCELIVSQSITEPSLALLVLTWFTWWSCPWKSLPQPLMPSPETWNCFGNITRELRPQARVIQQGMSTLARFVLAPHTLPVSILNMLNSRVVGSSSQHVPLVQTNAYVLAQLDSVKWPIYSYRAHSRPLPEHWRNVLIDEVARSALERETCSRVPANSDPKWLATWFPITNSGVSLKAVVHNLNILVNIHEFKAQRAHSKAHIVLPVLCWFRAAGFEEEDLKKMVQVDSQRKQLVSNLNEQRKVWDKPEFARLEIWCCVPVYTEVRYLPTTGKDRVELFRADPDSAEITRQWMSMILAQYNLTDQKSEEIFLHMRSAIDSKVGTQFASTLQDMVTDALTQIGHELVKHHKDVALDNHAKAARVVEDLLPLADFFAQLRASGSKPEYAKCAIEGLATALQQATRALQVCVADGFFILIGVTPENDGIEVLHMFHQWYRMGLAVGTSILEELNFMASTVYEPYLPDLAKSMVEARKLAHTTEPYIRKAVGNCQPLAEFLQGPITSPDDLYDFNDYKLPLSVEHEAGSSFSASVRPQESTASNSPARRIGSENESSSVPVRRANFDHARQDHARRVDVGDRSATPREITLFKSPLSEDLSAATQRAARSATGGARHGVEKPLTISARGLLHLETHAHFGVLKVCPGLHPVLRVPGDEQHIPFMKQEILGRRISSIDRAHSPGNSAASGQIAGIFSHSGYTWDHLNKLPPGSTLICRGFYLRKSEQGSWVLLLGASSENSVKQPHYMLWTLMDSLRIAALDLDQDVELILRLMIGVAYNAIAGYAHKILQDNEFDLALSEIRCWSQQAKDTDGSSGEDADSEHASYTKYLELERTVCFHFHDRLKELSNDKEGRRLDESFLVHTLEAKLVSKEQQGFPKDLKISISQTLCSIVGKTDPVPRSQLMYALEEVLENSIEFLRGRVEPDEQMHSPGFSTLNRLIAKHEHITQRKFRTKSWEYINALQQEEKLEFKWTTEVFADSDVDDDDQIQQEDLHVQQADHENVDSMVDNTVDYGKDKTVATETIYADSHLDKEGPMGSSPLRRDALFPRTWGYGRPLYSSCCVVSVLGEDVPLYFIQIDCRRMKIQYSDAEGLPVAFVFHKNLLNRALQDFKREQAHASCVRMKTKSTEKSSASGENVDVKLLAYRENLLRWITDLIRSPLPKDAKVWFIDKLQNGLTSTPPPFLGDLDADDLYQEQTQGGDLNLLVIAYCLATSLPEETGTKEIVRSALQIPKNFLSFCRRKDNVYGIHIVRGGTVSLMKDFGAVVEICDLGYDALTRAKDNSSMYLSIIGKFTKFTWIVYVQGLDIIDDALLKWLAEYTKAHPWRFVYLENTQTSWNFSENRDRCIYERAPIAIERSIRTTEDLEFPAVKQLRPYHIQPYERLSYRMTSDYDIKKMGWEKLSCFSWWFFSASDTADLDNSMAAQVADEHWSSKGPDGSSVMGHSPSEDYRDVMKSIFAKPEPCVVLLCSPPGAGKSHFSNELSEKIYRDHGYRRAFIDGSDDRLVDMALREILDLELPDSSKFLFLIIDEFHMLNEHHKRDLFEWFHERAKRLQVLLIANRKDSRDEGLLSTLKTNISGIPDHGRRVMAITTRLSSTLLTEVMQKYNTRHPDKIRRWMHCARALFGGEAVSLRIIKELDEIMATREQGSEQHQRLVDLLLNKIPIISSATAEHFVLAFLASFMTGHHNKSEVVGAVHRALKGPVSLMFQVALCTMDYDGIGMDFPDFVSFGLPRAYDAPPSLRIAAWCCHMRAAATKAGADGLIDSVGNPASIFHHILVDQCGFPLQLEEEGTASNLVEGYAFSWGGDYTRMREIIDAVKHGHSVDWTDVHERCWKHEPVQDSALLVELLSVCASPGKVLDALSKENLCRLLKSNPSDSLKIARCVLMNQTYKRLEDPDEYNHPFRTAVWVALLHDDELTKPEDVVKRIAGESTDVQEDMVDELVQTLQWASTRMGDMVTCERPQERTGLLLKILIHLSRQLLESDRKGTVPCLWHGMFAPLLGVLVDGLSTARDESNDDIIVNVAIHSSTPAHAWPQPVPVLWALTHGKGTASQVADLWGGWRENDAVDKHRRLLHCKEGVNARHRCDFMHDPIHPVLAAGILSVSGNIDPELQMALLTRGGDADLSHEACTARDPTRSLDSAIANMVKEGKEGLIQLADGEFKKRVMDDVEKYRQDAFQ